MAKKKAVKKTVAETKPAAKPKTVTINSLVNSLSAATEAQRKVIQCLASHGIKPEESLFVYTTLVRATTLLDLLCSNQRLGRLPKRRLLEVTMENENGKTD